MGRKMNPKSQENDRQNHSFLQIPLLQISKNTSHIKGDGVFHKGPSKITRTGNCRFQDPRYCWSSVQSTMNSFVFRSISSRT